MTLQCEQQRLRRSVSCSGGDESFAEPLVSGTLFLEAVAGSTSMVLTSGREDFVDVGASDASVSS